MTNTSAQARGSEWVTAQHRALNTQRKIKKLPEQLTPFQAAVSDVLGIIADGVYNAPIKITHIKWDAFGGVVVPWHAPLSFAKLSKLVFLCYASKIRVSVEATGRYMQLTFSQLETNVKLAPGGVAVTTLHEAVREFNVRYCMEHVSTTGEA